MLPISADVKRATILLAAVPSGFFGVLFGLRYGVKSQQAGSTLIASSVFSAVTRSCRGAYTSQLMRRPVAILCSGQGAQHSGMFDLCADLLASEAVFVAAGEALGQDPRRFVHEAAPEALFTDRAGQILCCTQALAIWAGLDTGRPARAVIAGYSVGELARSDWYSAGLPLWMLSRPRTLAGIIGLTPGILEPIVIHHDASIAIINGTRSFVIGGHSRALDACCEEAVASGATRAVRIRVSVPSHTKMLRDAVAPFSAVLNEAAPQEPEARYRLLSGIDGDIVQNIESACDKLSRQICTTVDWAACLESCREAEAELVLELGPETALSHMAASLFPDGRVRSTDEFRTMSGLRTWLSKVND